jgi:hypothetical protein
MRDPAGEARQRIEALGLHLAALEGAMLSAIPQDGLDHGALRAAGAGEGQLELELVTVVAAHALEPSQRIARQRDGNFSCKATCAVGLEYVGKAAAPELPGRALHEGEEARVGIEDHPGGIEDGDGVSRFLEQRAIAGFGIGHQPALPGAQAGAQHARDRHGQ